jgi:hypothetical protein
MNLAALQHFSQIGGSCARVKRYFVRRTTEYVEKLGARSACLSRHIEFHGQNNRNFLRFYGSNLPGRLKAGGDTH